MAGGAGERFWPVSRTSRPKQLLRLSRPDQSLLEEAVARVLPLFGKDGVFIATGKSVEIPIRESGAVAPENVWVEPLKRNTLGCLCWAAANLKSKYDENVGMAILTADHLIAPPEPFRDCIELALKTAEASGALVTIGIRPTRPETGFGYIELDPATEAEGGVFQARSFREKPDAETARTFVEAGNFRWNSGMFFWTLNDFLRELESAQPEANAATCRIADALRKDDHEAAERSFADLPNISIDFAVMEKASRVAVVSSRFDWDDVGSWDALERAFPTDEHGNVTYGDVAAIDAESCIVYNDTSEGLAAVLGVRDLLVVFTNGAVLVCPKSDAQRVKEIVQAVKDRRPELT